MVHCRKCVGMQVGLAVGVHCMYRGWLSYVPATVAGCSLGGYLGSTPNHGSVLQACDGARVGADA